MSGDYENALKIIQSKYPTLSTQQPPIKYKDAVITQYSLNTVVGIKDFFINLGIEFPDSITKKCKEYYDYKHPTKHTASYKDLLWDIGGSTLGSYSKNCSIDYHNGEVIVKYTWVLK